MKELFQKTILLLIPLLWMACSQKEKYAIPKVQLPEIELTAKHLDQDSISKSSIATWHLVYQALQDTLTDQEEGEIIAILDNARKTTSMNELVILLAKTGLLQNMVLRWDEAYLSYQEPSWMSKLVSSNLRVKPNNDHIINQLAISIFCSGDLTYTAAKEMASAVNMRYQGIPFDSAENACSSLQSIMLLVHNTAGLTSDKYKISNGTLALSIEAMKYPKGYPSFQLSIENRRKVLEERYALSR